MDLYLSDFEIYWKFVSKTKTNGRNFFFKKIIFSDKAHFRLGGYINKHKCRIWGSKNQHVVLQKPMHPLRAASGAKASLPQLLWSIETPIAS